LAGLTTTQTYYSLISPANNRTVSFLANNDSTYYLYMFDSQKFIDSTVDNTLSRNLLRSGNNTLNLRILATHNDANDILTLFSNAITRFNLKQNGQLMSNVLTANTVLLANASKEIVSLENSTDGKVLKLVSGAPAWADESSFSQVNSDWNATSGVAEILNKPTIPTDINELTDNDDLLFSGDYDDLDNKPNIPNNRHSFSTVDTIYLNKDDGETDLVQVTGLQVSLAQGKRYAIEIALYNLSSSDSRLTFFLDGDESWDLSSVFVAETNKLQNGLVLNDILDVNFRTEYELQTPDSNSRTVLRINGHIDTNTESGILKVLCRCSETGNTDFTRNVTILKNSYIRAIESSIN
jgi:hypothetical protein